MGQRVIVDSRVLLSNVGRKHSHACWFLVEADEFVLPKTSGPKYPPLPQSYYPSVCFPSQ